MSKPQPNTKQPGGVSNEAVKKATGHGWDEWISILDQAGAGAWSHQEIVAFLKQTDELSGWWQQTVTVAYEKAKGRRVVGQTSGTGFQVGVQKTIGIRLDEAWTLLASPQGIACWLGKVSRFELSEGTRYTTNDGTQGEIRVVKPKDRVRLTWHRPGMKRPATLQIALVESGQNKTSFRVHLEHLPSRESREEMRTHWKGVLDRLSGMAGAAGRPSS